MRIGRPPQENPRTEVVSVRVTKAEKEALSETGSAAAEIRRMLDQRFMVRVAPTRKSKRGEVVEAVEQAHSGHRHRRGIQLDSKYVNGAEVKQYLCADPDCGVTLS